MEKGSVKIGKNTPCPCGSGKQYRRCCKGKGVQFAYFEYGPKKFAYNLDAVNADLTRLSEFCLNRIITPFNEKKTVEPAVGLEILQQLYDLLDNVLAPFLRNSACTKGCKECCNLVVETTAIEADMISRYISVQFDADTKGSTIASIENAADQYGDPALLGDKYAHMKVERYLHSTLRCPFYSEQYTCNVYPARPLGCRTHIVFSPPRQCATRKTVDYYDGAYFPHIYKAVECLSALAYPEIQYEKHLSDWFVQEFKPT